MPVKLNVLNRVEIRILFRLIAMQRAARHGRNHEAVAGGEEPKPGGIVFIHFHVEPRAPLLFIPIIPIGVFRPTGFRYIANLSVGDCTWLVADGHPGNVRKAIIGVEAKSLASLFKTVNLHIYLV